MPHACGPHFVEHVATHRRGLESFDIRETGGIQHFQRALPHVLAHGQLIGAIVEVDAHLGHAPLVLQLVVQRDAVVGVGQRLAIAADPHLPVTRYGQLLLERHAEALQGPRLVIPVLPFGRALVAEAADVIGPLRPGAQVAEAGDVDDVGPPALVVLVAEPVEGARGAHVAVVVHQVAAQHAAAVAQSRGEGGGGGVQQDGRGGDGGGVQEDDLGEVLVAFQGLRIEYAHAAGAARGRVMHHLRYDGMGPEREVARGFRSRQGG